MISGGCIKTLRRPVYDSTVAALCATHGSREVTIRPLSYKFSIAHVFYEAHKLWGFKYQFKTKKNTSNFLNSVVFSPEIFVLGEYFILYIFMIMKFDHNFEFLHSYYVYI